MASSGTKRLVSDRTGRVSYKVWWRLDDGTQGAKTFAKKADAAAFRNSLMAKGRSDALRDRRVQFGDYATGWWATWSTHPRRSPNALQATESRLRRYVRPPFERRLVASIAARDVQQWQNALQASVGFDTVMACRSILYRILRAAEDDGLTTNPVRKVPAPKRPVDPEVVFGRVKRRTLTPEEAGQLLVRFPPYWWDHVVTLLGTGLRISELTGLQRFRVDLVGRRLEVVETGYDAGRFGKGLKPQPKTDASIRQVPLPRQVHDAILRQLSVGDDPTALVFTGPGRGWRRSTADRTALSRNNFRRLYQRAVTKAAVAPEGSLTHLRLRGPHDLRHTYATWLEEDGIPVRVIDELMGHATTSRGRREGSAIRRIYRHTTPEMAARVVAALEARLAGTLEVAAKLLPTPPAGGSVAAARWRERRADLG